MNKFTVIAVVLLATHYGSYWYGSQKPAQIIEKEIIKRDVVTQVVEVVRPDGSKEIKTIIIDKSKESATKSTNILKQKDWVVGAYYRVNQPTYALQVSRRLIGPFSASAFGDLKGNLYLGLSLEF